jgi:hypothetical protein
LKNEDAKKKKGRMHGGREKTQYFFSKKKDGEKMGTR